jgi:cephalosporin hydroxylase
MKSEAVDRIYQQARKCQRSSSTNRAELEWLWHNSFGIAKNRKQGIIFECGTYEGVSIAVMADAVKKAGSEIKLISVDNHHGYVESLRQGKHKENVAFIEEVGHSDAVDLFFASSLDLIPRLENSSVLMAYVDSLHKYNHVIEELDLLDSKLCQGGLLVCHDYCYFEPGVVRAVNEYIKKGTIIPGSTHGRLWWGIKG